MFNQNLKTSTIKNMSTKKTTTNGQLKTRKVLSLFTGAMGLDLGIEKAGFEVVACVENDKHCVNTIKLNRPEVLIYPDDINLIDPLKVMEDIGLKPGQLDLIVGGPPCQPFSTAGKRRSLNDFRGNVIVRFLEYVKTIRPKYFILENVRGILYAKLSNTPPEYQEYKGLEDIPGSVIYFLFKEFEKLGYKVSFNLFDSSLYSVPQRRERFVMFGALSDKPVKIPHPTSRDKPITLKEAIGKIQNIKHDFVGLRDVHIKYLKLLKSGQNWTNLPKGIQEEAMGKSFNLTGGRTGFYRRLNWDKPSPTLVTHPAMPATMLAHPDELRPLSIQEYALIQQFPKKWKFSGKLAEVYKQIGNAVPVGLGYVVGLTIIDHMEAKQGSEYEGPTSRYRGTSYKEFIPQLEKMLNNKTTDQLPLSPATL